LELALYPDSSLIELDDLTADKKAQTCAADSASGAIVNPIKLLEQMRNVFGWDAMAIVSDV
jgi:hypothetical protein